jgi:hypothetical protein
VVRADLQEGGLTMASVDVSDRAPNGPSYSPDVSDDGQTVSFASLATNIVFSDRNRQPDVFVRGGEFPAAAGVGDAPGGTATPDPAFIPPAQDNDDDGLSSWVVLVGAVALGVAALVGLWVLLGRRPEA